MTYTAEIENPVTETLYDLKQLKEMVGGNPQFLLSLADIYLTTIPLNSKQLLHATKAEDWSMVSKLAHKIKPTIDSMNITSISSDIRTLERNAKNQVNTHTLGTIAVKVDHIINKVARQLKYEFNL